MRDTADFVARVKALKLVDSCFLFSMDVESLYTNIDTQMGMAAVQAAFDRSRPEEHLLQLLQLNLTRNDFQFDRKTFLQIKGTAMGKRFSPAYANIYMAEWERTALEKCQKLPLVYLRYLDDIWGVWTHTREDFQEFVGVLNSHHQSIKLVPVLQEGEVVFNGHGYV